MSPRAHKGCRLSCRHGRDSSVPKKTGWPRDYRESQESSDRMRSGQAERVFIFLYTLLLVCYDSCCYLYRRIVFHFAVLFLVGRAPCAGCRNPLGLLRNLASWPPPRKRIRVRTTHRAPLVIYTRTTLPYFERMSNQVCQGVGPSNLIVHPQHTHRTQVLHDYHCALRRNMFFVQSMSVN